MASDKSHGTSGINQWRYETEPFRDYLSVCDIKYYGGRRGLKCIYIYSICAINLHELLIKQCCVCVYGVSYSTKYCNHLEMSYLLLMETIFHFCKAGDGFNFNHSWRIMDWLNILLWYWTHAEQQTVIYQTVWVLITDSQIGPQQTHLLTL